MAQRPSRPGFMIVGGLVFIALPFLFANLDHRPVDWRFVAVGVAIAIMFFAMAARYHRELRATTGATTGAPPAA